MRSRLPALEATFLTNRIAMLMRYEPPLHEPVANNLAVTARLEEMITKRELEQALITFQAEIVKQSPEEIARMKARPTWATLVASSLCIPVRCTPCRRIGLTPAE